MNNGTLATSLRIAKQRLGLQYLVGIKPLDGGDDWLEQALARMPADEQHRTLCQAVANAWNNRYLGITEYTLIAAVEDLVCDQAWAAICSVQASYRPSAIE